MVHIFGAKFAMYFLWKRYGEEFKMAVNFMDVDDVNFEPECWRTLLS